MIELEFLGRAGDGQSVVFTDDEGHRYTVMVTEALRGALRREANANAPVSNFEGSLAPRHIQGLLRQGMSAEELARNYEIDLAHIRKYEAPITAEKQWAVSRAKSCRIGAEADSPQLEELVINRLAARGVDPSRLEWDAARQPGQPWEISLTFIQGAVEKSAHWHLLEAGSHIEAIDQEALWLTETTAVTTTVHAYPRATPEASDDQSRLQEELVDRLNGQRGKRTPIFDEINADDEPIATPQEQFFSERLASLDVVEGISRDEELGSVEVSVDTSTAELFPLSPIPTPQAHAIPAYPPVATQTPAHGQQSPEAEKNRTNKPRSKRKSMPSWDEIVFGTRGE